MKMVIVEDESEILQGICETLTDLDDRVERIFAFSNAEDALAAILEERPEIIMTDIVLPEMTGLDMLQRIKDLHYPAKIVVISSYTNFSYAQKSIQLGALDYVLKPFDKAGFCDKIQNIIDLVEEENKEKNYIRKQIGYAPLGSKTLRDKFVLGLCLTPTALQEHIYHQLSVWNLKWLSERSYAAITINKMPHSGSSEKQMELEHFAIGNIAEETLTGFEPSIVFPNTRNQWTILSAYENIGQILDEIQDKLLKYQKLQAAFGVSETMNAFQGISEAYEQSIQACKLASLNHQPIVYYSHIQSNVSPNPDQSQELLAEYISKGSFHEVGGYIENVLQHFALSNEVHNSKQLMNMCFQWILNVHGSLADKTGNRYEFSPIEFWDKLERCHSIEEVKELIYQHFLEWVGKFSKEEAGSGHFIIEKAKKILSSKFADPISLQTVAEELAIHPVWLSNLFKRETGQNFLDYLTELRIETAKERLRNSNDKIYEIALSVGYNDFHYFGKLFKKRTGVTPKEFRYGR